MAAIPLENSTKMDHFKHFSSHLVKVNQGHWLIFYLALSQRSFWCQHYENRAKTKGNRFKNRAKTTIFENIVTFDLLLAYSFSSLHVSFYGINAFSVLLQSF